MVHCPVVCCICLFFSQLTDKDKKNIKKGKDDDKQQKVCCNQVVCRLFNCLLTFCPKDADTKMAEFTRFNKIMVEADKKGLTKEQFVVSLLQTYKLVTVLLSKGVLKPTGELLAC